MTLTINASTQQQQRWHRPSSIVSENEHLSTKENDYQQHHNHYSNNNPDNDHSDMIIEEDGSSSMSSSPSIPDENINFDLVYALHTFTATVEGQASVVKGDALILMEDTNIYWWLVEVLKTREIGYIPAENIETPYERLARLNKHRNVEITSPSPDTTVTTLASSEFTSFTTSSSKRVTIATEDNLEKINFYEVESDFENDDDLSADGDNESFQDAEQDKTQVEQGRQQQQQYTYSSNTTTQSPKVLVHPEDEDLIQSVTEIQAQQQQGLTQQQKDQVVPQQQPQQRPQQYLTPTAWKRDTSSLSLSSDGSSKHHSNETHNLRVFAGNIGQGPLFHAFDILATTTTDDLLKEVVKRFNIVDMVSDDQNSTIEYYIAVQGADGDDYILAAQDKPLSIFKTLTASLTTPMPAVSQNICRKPQENNGSTRRKRSSSFGNHEQTSYEEDSVIRFYVHRRIKRAQERQGLVYIKVSLYPDDGSSSDLFDDSHQQQHPLATSTTSSSPFFFKNKKKKLSTAAIKTEIDRIDKILPVSYDSLVGTIINTALEKFHVPDAEADGMQMEHKSHPLDTSSQRSQQNPTIKYYMSVRSGTGQETLLHASDIMANVLHDQQQQLSDHISSDLLFILRQCDSMGRKTRQQPPFTLSSSKQDRKSSHSSIGSSTGGGLSDDRRPSILDILMDSPRSADDRRPSYKSSPLASPRSFVSDRRRSNHSGAQERSNSLVPSVTDSSSSLALPNHGLSPPIMPITRSRQSSCSALSINASSSDQSDALDQLNYDSNNDKTNTDTKKRKEGSSFKQQLKRLVGWGSSSSPKLKKVNDLTISTSPSASLSVKSTTPNGQHKQPALTSQSAFVSTGSNFSFSKAEGMQSTISTTSAPTGVASASCSSLPQQISQPQQAMAGRSTSWYINNNNSSQSILPSTPPTISSTSSGQWQHVDSVMMVHDASYSQQQPKPEESNNGAMVAGTSSQELLPPPVPPKTGSQLSGISGSNTSISTNNSALVAQQPLLHDDGNDDDDDDDDDDMVSSSSSDDDDYDDAETEDNGGVMTSACAEDSDESDDPDRPEQRRRSFDRQGNQAKPTTGDTLCEPTVDNATSITTTTQPPPQQDDFDSDLFFLVTQGVDYLKTRECTKWEDEENGYRYHPWNRPQPLNSTILSGTTSKSPSTVLDPSPAALETDTTLKSDLGNSNEDNAGDTNQDSDTTTEQYGDKTLASPPLSPSNLAQPKNEKSEKKLSSSIVTPKQVSVDDEELKWIVNSHILF
ncbi:hypothetical protein BC941DRAFT_516549 [Chlamydoabsidia padenii]|nr:hypothetical protein BC941DRAFT_516549 [Chlamydoabsidia padenii]